MAQNNKIIITVSGTDKVGIVAKVATILSELNVNIEDIKQTLMQGHFVMFMLCDITNSQNPFKEIKYNKYSLNASDVCNKRSSKESARMPLTLAGIA